MANTPEGWNSVSMGDLFTPEQLEHIIGVWNKCQGDLDKVINELRPYFKSIEKELEAKGLLADYATYIVPFCLGQHIAEINKAHLN